MAHDDSIVIKKYTDNVILYEFPEDISGNTAYAQIRDNNGELITAFTCTIFDTYFLKLTLTRADLADIKTGNYWADVKLKSNTSPYLETVQFEIAVEIKDAYTQTP